MGDTVTIPLSRPIEAHGKTLTELELGELTLGALDGIDLNVDGNGNVRIDLGDIYRLVAALAGIPPSAAKTILVKDAIAARDALTGFFDLSQATGASA